MSAKKRERQPKTVPGEAIPPAITPPKRFGYFAWMTLMALAGFGTTYGITAYLNRPAAAPSGMILIPGGTFTMGTSADTPNHNEQPVHAVTISPFFMDETEVTNAQFAAFIDATGYITTAEKPIDWEEMKKQLPPGTPPPPPEQLVPGSMVFTPPSNAVPLTNAAAWWRWVPGANWRHPEGPDSSINDRQNHPVVQLSWDDAVAYAKWAGKRLPTEAEWEYAARGGLASQRFVWGNTPPTEADGEKANIWQGTFPTANTKIDGYDRTSPVKSYPANGYGLYDMSGNVWEWCQDWYRADAYQTVAGNDTNPKGPDSYWDPNEPLAPKRVTRGGSFLCHVTYCESYRPAARRGTAYDSGMSHIGFRCVKDLHSGS